MRPVSSRLETQRTTGNLTKGSESCAEARRDCSDCGPPCQAYSLVGRARNKGKEDYKAEEDHRHFLYREYLRIVHKTQPAIFVMENVKGILSSRVSGQKVFHDILRDLSDPGAALNKSGGERYIIHSLVALFWFHHGDDPAEIDANAFIIESERYGVPKQGTGSSFWAFGPTSRMKVASI